MDLRTTKILVDADSTDKTTGEVSVKGKVVVIDAESHRAAVQTMYGDYTVFELMNGDLLDQGDVLDGFLETLGPETVTNSSKKSRIKVMIKAAGTSREKAVQMVEDGVYPASGRRRRRPSSR
jgi:hypothetical protein